MTVNKLITNKKQVSDGNDIELRVSLEDLFKGNYYPPRAYALRFICSKEIAEDIVQDVFFELWSRRKTIRLEDKNIVKSCLFKPIYNRSINLIKSNALYTHTSLERINETQIIESYLSQHLCNQEHSLLLKELGEEIATYVETLPP